MRTTSVSTVDIALCAACEEGLFANSIDPTLDAVAGKYLYLDVVGRISSQNGDAESRGYCGTRFTVDCSG
jgi:hypothetical protein